MYLRAVPAVARRSHGILGAVSYSPSILPTVSGLCALILFSASSVPPVFVASPLACSLDDSLCHLADPMHAVAEDFRYNRRLGLVLTPIGVFKYRFTDHRYIHPISIPSPTKI